MAELLPVADAQARLFALGTPVGSEELSLRAAMGRWLAADVVAQRTQPFADLSAMDGYALRFADLPGPWRVVGESAAGHPFAGAIGEGEAVRIFTGAALPTGADTILVQEEAARVGGTLALAGEGPPRAGAHVRRKGLDFAAGETILSKGERLTPVRLALAGAAGLASVSVARRLRVAIAATGDELVATGSASDPAQLPETNGLMLAAMLATLPVDVIDLGILPDRLDALTAAFRAVEADVLVTTGGASVGDHDLVRPALTAAGAAMDFWKVALRPGKPMMAGQLGKTVVLGLPGNPVSAFVTAALFLKPLIAALSGASMPLPPTLTVALGAPLPANDRRQDYLRAARCDGRVVPAAAQDSSMLTTLASANCLVVRPPFAPAAEPGDLVEIISLA
ncbi:gephyrin-like molybdotransferase Glp [Sphingomonas aracearum]|uniref:Molybdopterin molybdenumtransferase n=1 Tax=Sphingomonas aracearum TaxID=2283317 RepID=A0A369VXM4_9SPHN|nr:gephyrin-like molybdotransferase Glp [Sphingomonas aracearum]RDE06375.1 molybdopterin molybdenumtransferase MoeA [Sphingomonas aracearum]